MRTHTGQVPAPEDADVSDSEDSLMIDSEEENASSADLRFRKPRGIGTPDHPGFENFDKFRLYMENKNTQRKTDTDVRIVISYLRSVDENRNPEDVPAAELDRYLSTFFTIVKKHDGNDYEPASLRGMLCSIERYLKMKNYLTSVTRDAAFVGTRQALKYKQQRLREIGKGIKKPNEPIGKLGFDRIHQLFSEQEMGPHTPMSVINTLCFVIIVHFRLRKAIDHKNLQWGDIELKTDTKGKEYLAYQPMSASNQSYKANKIADLKLCIWSRPELQDRDPISIYKLYSKKRPPSMQHENSPFYLGITTINPTPMQSWYRTCAMGVNKLSDLVRMIRSITGLPRTTLDGSTESILSANFSIPSTNDRLPYSYKPIPPVPNFTPIKPKPELPEASTEENSLTETIIEAEETSRSVCLSASESPLSQSDSENLSLVSNERRSDQTPLKRAKETICAVMQTLDQSDVNDLLTWLRQSRLDEREEIGKITDSNTIQKEPGTNENDDTRHFTLGIEFNLRARPGEDPIKITSVVTDKIAKNMDKEEKWNACIQNSRKRESSSRGNEGEDNMSTNLCKRNKIATPNPVNLTNENISNSATSYDDVPKINKNISNDLGCSASNSNAAETQMSEHLSSTTAEILPNFTSGYNPVPHAHMAPIQRPSFFSTHDPNWTSSLPHPSLYHRGGLDTVTPMTAHCSYTQYQFAQSLHSASSCQFPQSNL
ncbi:uncharacterized protein LOC133185814 [Saccostrea echinata]|uniref:uncharacterized protein LOC133185814 n=1 Tax=Saccostrea echinata TaxID=191078 RepID=UPI002A7FC0F4|nr:uncharacterized protein LOC133185814 [Saccostrea echinata]